MPAISVHLSRRAAHHLILPGRRSENGRARRAPFARQPDMPKHGFAGGLRIRCKSLIQGKI
jgi:hypothetical protein